MGTSDCSRDMGVSRGECANYTTDVVLSRCARCAESIAPVLLPLGEGGPKGGMRFDLLPSPAASNVRMNGRMWDKGLFPSFEAFEEGNRVSSWSFQFIHTFFAAP